MFPLAIDKMLVNRFDGVYFFFLVNECSTYHPRRHNKTRCFGFENRTERKDRNSKFERTERLRLREYTSTKVNRLLLTNCGRALSENIQQHENKSLVPDSDKQQAALGTTRQRAV